ncbi:AAA family ATPase [Cryobacterium sp. W22_MBD10_FK3]
MNELAMCTFDDLRKAILAKQEAARTDGASWTQLLEVVNELSALPASAELELVTGQKWSLVQVTIANFRGITGQLDLEFDPRPGITVLHGPNGAGKSSISDAIDFALSGLLPVAAGGTAGNAALWEPIPLSRNATSSKVSLTLASGGRRLRLQCSISSAGQAEAHSAELDEGAGWIPIVLDPSWRAAIASHQPVFAYASLERRVQLNKHLRDYFEQLLALGGCFTALKETIEDRNRVSSYSLAQWKAARDSAMKDVVLVEAQWTEADAPAVRSATSPSINENIDEWLAKNCLDESGARAESIPPEARSSLSHVADRLSKAIAMLQDASETTHQGLAQSLASLEADAVRLHLDEPQCPVCGSHDAAWLASLQATVAELKSHSVLRGEVQTACGLLMDSVQEYLRPSLAVRLFDLPTNKYHATRKEGQAALSSFEVSTRSQGISAHYSVLASAKILCDWILSTSGLSMIDEAVAQTDRLKQLALERTRAVNDFVRVWRTEQDSGSSALLWAATAKRVEELRGQLRKERTAALASKASARVQSLLGDVGMRIDGLTVQSQKASLNLVDSAGNVLELGMLSAGQRNAVLLAPLLASVDAGPFNFLVLDDPVHAFDELRIDRLAEALAVMAQSRRVIVLTHDERLREHVMARPIQCDARLVSRSIGGGTVTVEDSSHFWEQLLKDAAVVLQMSTNTVVDGLTTTDTVRGLCRQSVDNALRSFVVLNAVTNSRDTEADVIQLDEVDKTSDRLAVAEQLWVAAAGQSNPVTRARQACKDYLLDWNKAVHGNVPVTVVSRVEIDAARSACQSLSARMEKDSIK